MQQSLWIFLAVLTRRLEKMMIYDDAHSLITKIKNKEVSCIEVLEAFLKRVEKVNPEINAVVALDADGALEKAKIADEKISKGEELGSLHGLPMTIKDAFEVEGLISTGGNPSWRENLPKKKCRSCAKTG